MSNEVQSSNLLVDGARYFAAGAIVLGSKGALSYAAVRLAQREFERHSPNPFKPSTPGVGQKVNSLG